MQERQKFPSPMPRMHIVLNVREDNSPTTLPGSNKGEMDSG